MSAVAGKTVLLTRATEDNAAWAERLVRAGARCIALPCITTEPIADRTTERALGAALADADWLVFTSRRGIEAFASLTGDGLPTQTRVAVVGPATAAEAERRLGRVDLTSAAGTARDLAKALAARVAPGARVLIALAANAGDVLETSLAEAGAACTRIDLYRTVPVPPIEHKRALSSLGADNVLLASPSAVAGFVNQVNIDMHAALYTIGPSTSAAAQAAGLIVTAEAETPSLDGLMEAMK